MSNRFSTFIRTVAIICTVIMVIAAIVVALQLHSFWYFLGIALSTAISLILSLSYAALLDDVSENYAMLKSIKYSIEKNKAPEATRPAGAPEPGSSLSWSDRHKN